MRMKDIIGQQQVKIHLAELLYHNRLSHALLFAGREGSGGLPLALAFAQLVVCEKVNGRYAATANNSLFAEAQNSDQSIPTDSCGICSACIKAEKLAHPDIHYSYPVFPKKPGEKSVCGDFIKEWREFINQFPYGNVYDWLQFADAENRQGNINVHECNDIIRKLNLKSFESEYKVLVMWMPEYLGNEGNKLLKLIEEPPPNTLFILVAENEAQILPTILSRTQLIRVPPIETETLEKALISHAGIAADQARQIASISEGNFREALNLIQHADEDWQVLLRDWLNTIVKTGPVSQVKWIEEISREGREKQKQFLRYFNHLLQQAVRIRIMGPESRWAKEMPPNERDFADRLNRLADINQQQAIIEELDKATYHIERNAHAKMLFHALTIKLYHIIADKSLILIA